jgi:aquaporin Z
MSYPLDRKLAVEFIGTFFLVFTVGTATNKLGADGLAPLAIGASLMVMIFAGGHVSGAHFNPAVSTAAMLRGKLPSGEYGPYIATQLVAGLIAGLIARAVGGHEAHAAVANTGKMLVVEFLFTFALAWVVLNVATAKATEGNSFYGLAIGFTVLTGAFAVGGISGGAFNPAVALGATVLGAFKWAHIWIYLIADLAGGAAAAFAFLYVHPEESKVEATA